MTKRFRWLSALLALAMLMTSVAPVLMQEEPVDEPAEGEQVERVYVPLVSAGDEENTVQSTVHADEVKETTYNALLVLNVEETEDGEVQAASIDEMTEGTRVWLESKLARCDYVNSLEEDQHKDEKFYCRMLQYTLEGEFTKSELELIRENGNILLQASIAEAVVHPSHEEPDETEVQSDVSAADVSPPVTHPNTGELLRAAVDKVWWESWVHHYAFAGNWPGESQVTYPKVKMRYKATGKDNNELYNEYAEETSDNQISRSYNVGIFCCYRGGEGETMAYFRAWRYEGGVYTEYDVSVGPATINF